jgi:hypothetical protein
VCSSDLSNIKIYFNKGINPNSVSYINMSVNDYGTYVTVPGTLGLEYTSGVADVLVFNPNVNLSPVSKYKVYVYGKENSVISVDSEQMDDTYSYAFTTGTGLYGTEDDTGLPLTDEETAITYSGMYLSVVSTSPKNQTPNLSNLEYISIKFNYPLNLSGIDVYDYVTVTSKDVLE